MTGGAARAEGSADAASVVPTTLAVVGPRPCGRVWLCLCGETCWNEAVPDGDQLLPVEQHFSEIAQNLFASGTVEATLQQIVSLAEEAIDGCLAAGVLVIDDDGSASSVAGSSPLAETVERFQVDVDEGPCVDAARSGVTFYAEDLTDDPRWPSFGPAALEHGVRSVLAYSMSARRLGALNLYSDLPAAFGAIDRAKGQLFATLARLALDSAESQAAAEFQTAALVQGMGTREIIGQAQGILMERERITAEQAFDVLRRASQHLNVKLREVATRLVETGESPETGPTP